MQRILIAIEDFNELLYCETILKKVGFDTQSFQTELAISEAILTFNPDLLIMSAMGSRVNGVNYLSKLKTKNKTLPVILIGQRNRLNVSDKQIIALLEPPLSPRILIEVLSSLFHLDEEALLSKYEKSSDFKNVNEKASLHVKGSASRKFDFSTEESDTEENNAIESELEEYDESDQNVLQNFKSKNQESQEKLNERASRYRKIANSQKLPPFVGFTKEAVQDQVKFFRRDENSPEIKNIDEERRMFAIELARRFKRNP